MALPTVVTVPALAHCENAALVVLVGVMMHGITASEPPIPGADRILIPHPHPGHARQILCHCCTSGSGSP